MKKVPLAERFEHLKKVISSQRFLKKQGLGNEVPFFICPYGPDEAVEFERHKGFLLKDLAKDNVNHLEVNLYDLSVELLKKRGIWERVLEAEPTVSKGELLELLQGVLDPADHLIPAIADKMKEMDSPLDVLFISGVGEVFPYVRSHNVLNNLQRVATEAPTVMFFPGDYTHTAESGASLVLFGRLGGDRYYRAFDIFHYQV